MKNEKQRKSITIIFEPIVDFIIALILAFLAIASVFLFFLSNENPVRELHPDSGRTARFVYRILQSIRELPNLELWIFLILIFLSLSLGGLFFYKLKAIRNKNETQAELNRERKINSVNRAVFESLNQINMSKVRETLRYTYGCVPEWNPIDYTHNILTYDVHEQIRAILISLKQVVIGLDPSRFNDHNVSVELVYCYPEDDIQEGALPYQPDKYRTAGIEAGKPVEKRVWKLISSGDTSGNHSKVIRYLEEPNSFYTFLDYCGIRFVNDKFAPVLDSQYVDSFRTHLLRSGYDSISNIGTCFYSSDTKDIEHSKDGKMGGSVAGAVINIRNDDPEEIFVKAILTINTYGESIHIPEEKNTLFRKAQKYDRDGMTIEDYNTLFCDNILGTYITLLTSEFSQMYIRHAIRSDKICMLTGRKRDVEVDEKSLLLGECLQCSGECVHKPTDNDNQKSSWGFWKKRKPRCAERREGKSDE